MHINGGTVSPIAGPLAAGREFEDFMISGYLVQEFLEQLQFHQILLCRILLYVKHYCCLYLAQHLLPS